MMLAISKQDKHSSAQSGPVAACTIYVAIYGSCTSSSVCSIRTIFQAICSQAKEGACQCAAFCIAKVYNPGRENNSLPKAIKMINRPIIFNFINRQFKY